MIIVEFQASRSTVASRGGGRWLDAGELTWIAELAGAQPGKISECRRACRPGPRMDRRCPRCNRRLRAITVAVEDPIELDRCPKGHGLWFDAGEMQAVISAFHSGEDGEVARLLAEATSRGTRTQ